MDVAVQHPYLARVGEQPLGERGAPHVDRLDTRLLTNVAILADALAIDRSRILEFTYAYAGLSASWSLRIGAEDFVQWALNIAAIIEPHIELF